MHPLRRIHLLACFWLACFALSLGAAAAAPFVQPQVLPWICSGTGDGHLQASPGSAQALHGHTLDCPLCLPLGTPAPLTSALAHRPAPPAALPPARAVLDPPTARSAAPLPARGPPPV